MTHVHFDVAAPEVISIVTADEQALRERGILCGRLATSRGYVNFQLTFSPNVPINKTYYLPTTKDSDFEHTNISCIFGP